ncbi:hypothetical protein [Sphaerochaeta pleomorpha]|uniref:hypothetical protein n=1 Tax=Sphaerochaeta pleomorpha TaxID=1131707 RepID=UPI00059C21F9|nr:hypothetical protein [Sphaerochaeta pleomorpha]
MSKTVSQGGYGRLTYKEREFTSEVPLAHAGVMVILSGLPVWTDFIDFESITSDARLLETYGEVLVTGQGIWFFPRI